MPLRDRPHAFVLPCLASALSLLAPTPRASGQAAPPENGDRNAAQEGAPAVDAAVAALMARLEGSYRDDSHVLRITPVGAADMPRAMYVEFTRDGAPLNPMVQQVWAVWNEGGEVRVRLCEFAAAAPFGASYIGAWASPDYFPRLTPDRLDPVADFAVAVDDASVGLRTDPRGPVFRNGAIAIEASFNLRGDKVEWRCAGIAEDGKPLWGDETFTLTRVDLPPSSRRQENGLVLIDLRPGDGEGVAVEVGDSIAMHLDGYTFAGLPFISTGPERANAFQTQIPGDLPDGLNEGVVGMTTGAVRRVLVPPWLGFDVPGVQRPPVIPQGAWLIFDVEIVSIRDNTPQPGQDAPQPGKGLPIPVPGGKPN